MEYLDSKKLMEILFQAGVICLAVLLAEILLGVLRYILWRRRGFSLKELLSLMVRGQHSQRALLKELEAIKTKLDKLLRTLGQPEESLDTGGSETRAAATPARTAVTPLVTQTEAERSRPESDASLPWSASFNAICRLYNAGVTDPNARQEFRSRYELIRIGPVNSMARRRDPSLKPEFQTLNGGDYYALPLDEGRSRYYAVVPRFDLYFQESNYGPGAMSMVFECDGFNPQQRYLHVKVVRPALFESGAGETWHLDRRGKLDLGRGE